MSTPQTTIYICSGVRLDNRYDHSIYFASRQKQEEYFAGKVVKTFSAYSYVRKTWPLQVSATMEEAKTWSYLYFHNGTGKTYFYFITRVEYKNDNMVELTLELDVLQTYLFDFDLLDCFVERQHTETDEIGEHTVPEGLELGPYWNYHQYQEENIKDLGLLVLSTIDLTMAVDKDNPTSSPCTEIDGIYTGLGVYAFNSAQDLDAQLSYVDKAGRPEAIVAIWLYPKRLLHLKRINYVDTNTNPARPGGGMYPTDYTLYLWSEYPWAENYPDNKRSYGALVDGTISHDLTLANYDNYKERIFQGHPVKNNKLYTYPYNLLYATTHQGDKADYRFEHFNMYEGHDWDGLLHFQAYGAVSPDAGVKMVPAYNIQGWSNYDEGITLSGYPLCAWSSDAYTVWMARNMNQQTHAVESATVLGITSAVTAVGSLATGNIAGAVGGGMGAYHAYNQIQGIMAQREDAKTQPPQAMGTFSSTVNAAHGRQTITFYYKCVRKEYAKQIDDYFTMYGYKLNQVQKPNINARPAFTFVKTVGCNIVSEMCTEDVLKIESIFDRGVTWWKNGDRIGDYSQDNQPT